MTNSKSKMTASSNESFLESIFAERHIFDIPFFQRSYKWRDGQIGRLIQDLQSVLDDEKEVHFLGAIIFHQRASEPGKPQTYEVIDGQQRLTTVFLLLAAIVRWMVINKHFKRASELFLSYLVIERLDTANSKLHSSKDDRGQLNKIFETLIGNKEFQRHLGSFSYIKLPEPSEGTNNGPLRKNFNRFLKFINNSSDHFNTDDEKIAHVENILSALVSSFSIVQLNVNDKSNGPVIFDSLNAAQEPMTIGDLVKNGIFAKASSSSPDELTNLHDNIWEPFASGFSTGKAFTDFFFPFGLIKDPNTKKNQTYNALQKTWMDKNPNQIIDEMKSFQPFFNACHSGLMDGIIDEDVKKQLVTLHSASIPQSSLPFLMALLKSNSLGETSNKNTCEIIHNLECFFVRRSLCGHEPSGLHAVFKRLWRDLENPTATAVMNKINKLPTVKVPDDTEVVESVKTAEMYRKSIRNFFLQQYNASLGGEIPSDTPHIEHVLPQKLSQEWKADFSAEQHTELVHTAGNLVPVTSALNLTLSRKKFSEKKLLIEENSMFKSARQLTKGYSVWTPETIVERSTMLGKWAVKRWSFI